MKSLKLVAMTFALVTATTQIRADQTNFVQTLNVRLQATKQGETTTNRNVATTSLDTDKVDTRDIIGGIGVITGNNFSPASRLVLVTPLGGGSPSLEIRDGNSKVDVTAFLIFEQIGGAVTRGVQHLRTGDTISTTYSIQRLALQDYPDAPSPALRFDARGLAVDTENTRNENGQRFDLRADLTGSGDSNGTPMVLQGNLTISGGTLEVVTDGELPPPA